MPRPPASSPTTPPGVVAALPLTSRAPGEILFRRAEVEVTVDRFLRDVAALAARLPDRRHALNLCADRYGFLVAFAAALVRGQVSLLSSDRSARGLAQIAERYPDTYTLGDEPPPPGGIAGVEHHAAVAFPDGRSGRAPAANPSIPSDCTAAIVFTSGSTGDPVPNPKPWAALVACSEAAAERFGLADPGAPASIVGTVPPQHMYGFETTVLLPLHAAASSYAGSTFFPRDVADALARVPGPRTLVTTPLQIRALLAAGQPLPPLAQVISATAPLPAELAAEAEAAWGTRVLEIFGATEVGSIASRRTVEGDVWRHYRTVRLVPAEGDGAAAAEVAHLPGPVILADRVELRGDGDAFRLLGRLHDVVKLAGKRASLDGLSAILRGIDGVEDGAFFAPDDLDSNPRARLSVLVVAPTRSADEIAAALRARVEAPFLPRRVVMVGSLPRNEVGKLPRAALAELLRRDSAAATGRPGSA